MIELMPEVGVSKMPGYLKSSVAAFQVARKGAGYLKIENRVRSVHMLPKRAAFA